MLKRFFALFAAVSLTLCGCSTAQPKVNIAATTMPVYEFTEALCESTGLSVGRLVTENVSCLHDYTLNVRQARMAEAAELIVISGNGLEDFMADLLEGKAVLDSSAGISTLECHHEHDHDHHHEEDAHIWLSPDNALLMAKNICTGLKEQYPEYADTFSANLETLLEDIEAVKTYGKTQLSQLSCRELVTFHDGFGYLADAFGLTILRAIEEESGSEASAQELKELTLLVREHSLPAIFTEKQGSVSAAGIITAETGVKTYTLDMAMAGSSWFTAMYHNIDTLKEALE